MKIVNAWLLLCVGFLCLNANCKAETAEEMLSACRPVANAKVTIGGIAMTRDFDSGVCWGAFGAIQSWIFIVGEHHNEPMFHICAPFGGSRSQLVAVFVRYIEKHPEKYGDDFGSVALDSLAESFPCRARR
jgi:hypothetical protein